MTSTAVDPELAELLRRVHAAPPLSTNTPERARELFRRLPELGMRARPPTEVGSVEDIEIAGAAGPLRARIYRPRSSGPHATLVFFHGGGFTIGDVESYDPQCRTVCDEGDVVVVSVDYRLAPEHPFPAAVEDALAATRSVAVQVADGGPLAVGGDSAGGNLAAIVAQQLRGGEPAIAAQLLIYPATDLASDRPSHRQNAEGYFLTRDDIEWFHGNYLPDRSRAGDVLASPLNAEDLSGLPPAVIGTAELDPLRDDGDAYAEALAAAGVPVVHRRFDGLVHGFFGFGPFSSTARAAISRLCADLSGLLNRDS